MKIICSFDVGINNLAYCVLKKENEHIEILMWDNINISGNKTITCVGHLKNGNKCPHKACFIRTINSNIRGYCGTHKNLDEPIREDYDSTLLTSKDISKACCSYTNAKTNSVCSKKANFNYRDHRYCKCHFDSVFNSIQKIGSLEKVKKSTITSSPYEICSNMYNKFVEIDGITDVDEVLVENQPGFKNPRIKSVAGYIFSYFTFASKLPNSRIKNVIFKSAGKKLQDMPLENKKTKDQVQKEAEVEIVNTNDSDIVTVPVTGPVLVTDPSLVIDPSLVTNPVPVPVPVPTAASIANKKAQNKYVQNKKHAIDYTQKLLETTPKWLNFLSEHKKKDDLSDAFLQGYYYLMSCK